jgi:hypothetical protein
MKRFTVGVFVVVALCMAGSAYAHHSSASADTTKTITVEGTVKMFKWANPHSWVELEAVNTKGVAELWNFEMTSPALLIPSGWKATTLKAGDKIKVTAHPLKSGEPGGLFMSVALPSGQVLSGSAGSGGPQPPAATQTAAPVKP